MYQLTGLLEKHPAMRMVVVTEVERLLYRQNINPKAQYYGICFLSTIVLDRTNSDELAARLITIYFSFFKVSVTKGEVDTKLMKALLTGVNRAFPYASLAPGTLEEQLGTMHKLVHMVSFNTAIQALTLLHQVMEGREAVTDRCLLNKPYSSKKLSSLYFPGFTQRFTERSLIQLFPPPQNRFRRT